ncbi:MAG: TlpA family protein disulfide reductase [Parapedobacter sp.]|nr:MAG: TlpA family protein disulfide reductase [Parapedobacter sp.]
MKLNLRIEEGYALSKIYLSLSAVVTIMCLEAVQQVSAQVAEPAVTAIQMDNIEPLQIGDTIPEYLWHLPLQVVNHPEGQETITLNDYRNRLIILDFWATWCVPCVKSLGKLDSLQGQFIDDIAIIPITDEDSQKAASFFRKRGWTLPTTTRETILKQYFPHESIPYQVWLKDGRVFAIPMHEYATGEVVASAIKGEPLPMPMNEYVPLDRTKPLFLNGNGGDGSEVLYYSAISSRIRPRVAGGGVDAHAEGNKALFINMPPDNLFRYAFEGDIGLDKRRVIWETSDSLYRQIKGKGIAKPIGDYARDRVFYDWTAQHFFCYNLFSKKEMDAAAIYATMQKDLNQYFGVHYGINAALERRKIPCLVLRTVHTDTARLKSKGGPQVIALGSPDGYQCVNAPFTPMIRAILAGVEPGAFLVDSTYYNGMVDITMPRSIDGNFAKAQKELARYGLKLFREEIEMDMLVIKEIFNQ